MSKEKKKRFEGGKEIFEDEAAREFAKKLGLPLEEKVIKVKASDWNWFSYAIIQLSKVINVLYKFLKPEDIRKVEAIFDEEVKEERMRSMLKILFEASKGEEFLQKILEKLEK